MYIYIDIDMCLHPARLSAHLHRDRSTGSRATLRKTGQLTPTR